MKSASIPSLRVSAELRKQAESVLQPGESEAVLAKLARKLAKARKRKA